MNSRLLPGVLAALWLFAGSASAQAPPATQKPAAKKSGSATAPPGFEKLVEEATAARLAERWEEAIGLYAKSVKVQPDYVEGYWYQGTAYYTLENYARCADMFRRVIRLAPQNGAAYAFVGLCEFGRKNYERALIDLLRSRALGVGDTGDLGGIARYHAALLLTRSEQFEQALETLGEFAMEGNDNPRVIEAMGLATLRMPLLPNEAPPERREMLLMAGRASYVMATRNTAAAEVAFKALVARYTDTPNVHYAYGVYLLQEQPDRAIAEFKRELELQPAHPSAVMQIAYEYLKRGDAAAAMEWARKAVELAPGNYAARRALGQALLETGEVDGAVRELESAVKLAPDSPSTHFALARAYQRAGRMADATRAREEFTRLDRLARAQKTGTQSIGGK